jgi:hypothetical protein
VRTTIYRQLRIIRRAGLFLAAAAWAYALYIAAILIFHWLPAKQLEFLATWAVVPLQLIGLLLGGYMLTQPGLVNSEQRTIWKLLWAFFAMSAVATYMWNFARPQLQREVLNWADLPYLAEYWLLIAVFVVLFRRAGGSFRQPRVWLDILTMLAVQLVGVWSFFIAPGAAHDARVTISAGATAAYSASLAALLTIVTLACLQLPSYRGRYGQVILIGAAANAVS